jgi:hypothetical protein
VLGHELLDLLLAEALDRQELDRKRPPHPLTGCGGVGLLD